LRVPSKCARAWVHKYMRACASACAVVCHSEVQKQLLYDLYSYYSRGILTQSLRWLCSRDAVKMKDVVLHYHVIIHKTNYMYKLNKNVSRHVVKTRAMWLRLIRKCEDIWIRSKKNIAYFPITYRLAKMPLLNTFNFPISNH
jgi:hypothetical protein